MSNTLKARRGTAAELVTLGALEAAEFGKTTDTHRVLIGDGVTNHEFVMHDLFDAQSIIAAVTDDTPVKLAVAEQTLVGRITGGDIDDLSAAQAAGIVTTGGATSTTIAAIDYYVRTDGNDTNDGSANDSGHAFLTIQKAVDMVPDVIAHAVEIHVEDGTYEETVSIRNKVLVAVAGSLTLTGDTTTPANTTIAGDTAGGATAVRRQCLIITNCTDVTINGFTADYGGADTGSFGDRANVYIESSAVRLLNFDAEHSAHEGIVAVSSNLYLGDYNAGTNPVSCTDNTNTGLHVRNCYVYGGAITLTGNSGSYGMYARSSYILLWGDASNDVNISANNIGILITENTYCSIRYFEEGSNTGSGFYSQYGSVAYLNYTNIATGANGGNDLAASQHGMIRHVNDDTGFSEGVNNVDRDDIWS